MSTRPFKVIDALIAAWILLPSSNGAKSLELPRAPYHCTLIGPSYIRSQRPALADRSAGRITIPSSSVAVDVGEKTNVPPPSVDPASWRLVSATRFVAIAPVDD